MSFEEAKRGEEDICSARTVRDVRAMKRAHKGGTWKYACACRSGVRYEGESEAWGVVETHDAS